MPTDPSQTHVLLYSFNQGCFHLETLDKTVAAGMRAYASKHTKQDYIVLAVGPTRDSVADVRDRLVAEFGRHEPNMKPPYEHT